MKVLLLIPPELYLIESYTSEKITKTREFRPKLGILCIAGYLRDKTGVVPVIIDCPTDGFTIDQIEGIIEKCNPDIVGMSVLTFNLLDCLEAANRIKHKNKNIKICFGGFHPTLYPRETCELEPVDFVVIGEGEETFSELIMHLSSERMLSNIGEIDGLAWKDSDGTVIINSPRNLIDDLDKLGLPAHDLIDISKYSHALSSGAYTAYIQTSRGCPFNCRFCDMRMTKFRSRSVGHVFHEIRVLLERGVKEIFFLDDTITVNKKRLISLCQMLLHEKIKIKYKISSRVNTIDEEMLYYLKKSGCVRIHFGVESGSQRILNTLQKGITIEQIIHAFDITKRSGMATYAYLMIGIPTETADDLTETLSLVRRIRPDYVTYSICTPFPKTQMYQDLLHEGYYRSDYWLEFAQNPTPSFKTQYANEFFLPEQLRKIQDDVMAQFYSRSDFLFKELIRTRSLKQLARKIKLGYQLLFGYSRVRSGNRYPLKRQ